MKATGKKIRILFDMGDGLHTLRWCGAMLERGFDCHMIRRDPGFVLPGAVMHTLASPVRIRGRRSLAALLKEAPAWRRFGPVQNPEGLSSRVAEYREIAARVKPDLVHVNLKDRGYWAALADFRPLVVSILGADLYDDARWNYNEHSIATHLFRAAAAVTADTPHAAEVLAGWDCPVERFHEIHWGVDLSLFGGAPGPAPELAALPDPLFLSNRSAVPNSCLDTVLRAFARVRRRRRCSLVLGGRFATAETDAELRSLVRKNRIPDVLIVRDIDHAKLPSWYARASAFVSVPYSDGTSVSVLEAMAMKRPLILSDIPANRALVDRGAEAFLVPVMDVAALAESMERIAGDASRRRRMGERNRRAVGRYEAGRQMDRMAELYRKIARTGHA